MATVAERLRGLRESLRISQSKLAEISGTNQSSINRYEHGQSEAPYKILLWYADYFDVSLDYIFGRTDKAEGKLYTGHPSINSDNEEIRQFIEMCFDPKSKMSVQLKDTLYLMMTRGDQ